MGAKVGVDKEGMHDINVTPLIDIVLVLLIIFMVLTPITVNKMAQNLPPTEDIPEPPEPPKDQMMVAVYDDGALALNLKPYSDADLLQDLRRRLRGENKNVFVDAHPGANYARVVQVIDLIRDAGAQKVGFADLKDEGPARLPAGMTYEQLMAPPPAPPAP